MFFVQNILLYYTRHFSKNLITFRLIFISLVMLFNALDRGKYWNTCLLEKRLQNLRVVTKRIFDLKRYLIL